MARPPSLIFHARDRLLQGLVAGRFRLLAALADHATARGIAVQAVPASPLSYEVASQGGADVHVFLEDQPLYAPRAFHAVPGYLRGYWYFDELGVRNNSSNRLRVFDPRSVAQPYADRVHGRLVAQFVDQNLSKFEQFPRGNQGITPGSLVFFAQDFLPPRHHAHFLTVPQMIAAAVAARGARKLYLKPHPNNTPAERAQILAWHDPVAGVEVTDASIHDLLADCACCLTVTSAVGFEAFLHCRPVVLGGQTDFAQNAVTLTDPACMAQAIDRAMATDWPHARFVTWFLKHQLVEDRPASLPSVLARMQAKGIDWADATGQGWF